MTHHHRPPSSFAAYCGQIALAALATTAAFQGMPRQWVAPPVWATTVPESGLTPEVAEAEFPTSPVPIFAPLAGPSQDFSWWPWIAAFPALGLLLWWILRQGTPTATLTSEKDTPSEATPATTAISAGAEGKEQSPNRRIILTPYTLALAYSYWELPPSEVDSLRQHNNTLTLKLHDVTAGNAADQPSPTPQWHCAMIAVGDRHLPIAQGDRDYCVELGYEDEAATWHSLVRSAPVRIAASASDPVASEETDEGEATPLPHPEPPSPVPGPNPQRASASLIVQGNRSAVATWEIPPDSVQSLPADQPALSVRLYDVTELPGSFALGPNTMQVFEVERSPQGSLTLPITVDDRDYLIEVGYLTEGGQWQVLAKSTPVRVADG